MTTPPSLGLEPGADPRDWPRAGSFLRATPFAFDARSPVQTAAREAAGRLARELPEVHSVHLTGSAIEPGTTPADVDLAVVLKDDAPSAAEARVRRIVARWPAPVLGCTWDVLVDRRIALERQPLRCLALAVRSLRLAGPCPWPTPPAVRADASTASLLFAPRRRELTETLRALLGALERDPDVARVWLAKTQKRALRIGMLEALARFGTFATDPARCAELTARAVPDLAALALAVGRDVAAHDAAEAALDRATELAGALLSRSRLAGSGAAA